MRYDIVTRDAVVPPRADFSPAPGVPDVLSGPTYVRGAASPAGREEDEDAVLPLFPDVDVFADPDYLPAADKLEPAVKVRFRLTEVCAARGLINRTGHSKGKVNLSALARGTDMAYAGLHKMLREPQKTKGITWDVLERLCSFLHCSVSDLIALEPRAEAPQTDISDYFTRRARREGEDLG